MIDYFRGYEKLSRLWLTIFIIFIIVSLGFFIFGLFLFISGFFQPEVFSRISFLKTIDDRNLLIGASFIYGLIGILAAVFLFKKYRS